MQYLTADESHVWAAQRGFRLDAAFGQPLRFTIPADAGARVTLARTLWETVGQGAPEVLLWVTEWSVWPSGEHLPLAEAVRRGFGAERPLEDAPGHVVRLGEDDAGLSVLCLAVLFLWDCWVLPAERRPALFLSHDEFGVLDLRGDDRGLRRRLEVLGLLDDRAPAT